MASFEVSYTAARDRLDELWDRVVAQPESILLTRQGHSPVVLIAASEADEQER